MNMLKFKTVVPLILLVVLTMSVTIFTETRAQTPAVDPAATEILKRMTNYLGSLKQFSVHTQNTLEDVLDSGHRIDLDVSASVTVSRPNKIRAERKGDLVDQVFYYNGTTLTLYNPSSNVYATEPASDTFEEMFIYLYDTLGFGTPISDLVYSDSFPLLMKDVIFAAVIGKSFINSVKCDHLLFSRPGVDFQVWVSEGSKPLPLKYVVTDTTIAGLMSVVTIMSDWNVAPAVDDDEFTFVPPKGVQKINFMPF
ncbi:MAG: DUF2092 domain-containing protein [Desulfobulbaceae bacterium]|jgi:hypothetical protein|nr:DUF2092 domain-containing protein [Desulfobulbaceae bacterium]HKJ13286.1 DUF2092 domain-containing protein [Desulfobulbales bacterium]